MNLLLFLIFFWFFRTTKAVLLWIYLWQIKEYRIDRFKAHFSTEKGKRLIANKLLLIKVILVFGFLFSSVLLPFFSFLSTAVFLVFLLLILYFLEILKTFKDFFQRKIKKPILTKKTIPILFFTFILFIFIPIFLWQKIYYGQVIYDYPPLHAFCFWILLIDIFTPIIVSAVILFFQPIAVLWRNKAIRQAKQKREKFKDLLVIGITGSYGKTSTKEFLNVILSQKYKVLKTEGNNNTEIGVANTVLQKLKKEHQIFICEMAAYKIGEIKTICEIAKPKIGILTGINEQHIALFGSQENIIKAKFELIESLPKNGLAIFNGNNKFCQELYLKTQKPKKLCNRFLPIGRNLLQADFWAEDIKIEKEAVNFRFFSKDGDRANFKINLLGAQNIENILTATCCAKELGMSLEEISRIYQTIKPMPGAGKLIKTKNNLNIIDATYSANPNGVISHLDYLKVWSGKKVIVMPCLIELGKASREVHQRIGRKIGEVCDLAIITTKECFENIKNGIESGGNDSRPNLVGIVPDRTKILFLEDPEKIFEKIKEFNQPEDIILLEGRMSKVCNRFLPIGRNML